MKQINDYDSRQIHHMLQTMDLFLTAAIGLGELVGTLSFLLEHLDEISNEWKASFRDIWMLLEIIHAEAHEQKRKLTEAERQYTLDKTRELKRLVHQLIN